MKFTILLLFDIMNIYRVTILDQNCCKNFFCSLFFLANSKLFGTIRLFKTHCFKAKSKHLMLWLCYALSFQQIPGDSPRPRRNSTDVEYARPSSVGEEEIQLQLALAMSKEEHEESMKKQKSDDIKLQLALEESRKQVHDEVSREVSDNSRKYSFF